MRKTLALLCLLTPGLSLWAQLKTDRLLCENKPNPIGIDAAQPRFSWQLDVEGKKGTAPRDILQTAYELRVAKADAGFSSSSLVWNSGRVSSDQSIHITYAGSPLESGKQYFWQVRVWDNKGHASPWSSTQSWRMGMLQPSDWKAQWIEAGFTEDESLRTPALFRKRFNTNKKLKSAIAFITAHGMYEAYLNGQRIGDAWLTPGWTSYNRRLEYQVYDVTNLLKQGENVIGAMVGDGWYRGGLTWDQRKDIWGKKTGLLVQLEMTYSDGSTENIISDPSWKSSTGPVLYSEIYNGETIDARKEKGGWNASGYDDTQWSGVNAAGTEYQNLVATWNEPVRKHETLKPVNIFTTPAGEQVLDFGQNLVGFVRVRIKGNAGDSIKLYHAEVLDKKGNFYTTNLRSAKQENIYILSGKGTETFEPHFSWQGFRYVHVEGVHGPLTADMFEATALYSDMPVTGTFSCSNPMLNQLQHNIIWGQQGNFLDVPTDCPQRDERLGWTGDAQVFCRTASFNRDVENFFAKWLKDVAADQFASGAVPHVVPNVLGPDEGGSAGWSDVATIAPWTMYLVYGDKKILADQYPSMTAWIRFMDEHSTNHLWNRGGHFGDWLSYYPEGHGERAAITDQYLIAQAFFAYSLQLTIKAAGVLGKSDDVKKYQDLLDQVKAAFLREYVTPGGRMVAATQTAYVLALQFDLLPEDIRAAAADRLVKNIHDYKDHLTTGFLGTPYLCHVLSRYGHTDVAYTLLLQQSYPSWLYPVKMGATTIWERWDGQKTDSTFEDAGMNSFNHYAYGAIGDWMYRVMAGIDTYEDGPGYKKIKIMPHPGGDLTYANADYKTPYGLVSSHWKKDGAAFIEDVVIPANTSAIIYIPGTSDKITEGGTPLSVHTGMNAEPAREPGYTAVEVGSGVYHFEVK